MILLICLAAVASALAMAILYEPGADPSRIYYGTDTRAFSLLIGAVLALVWPSNRLANKIIPKARFILDVVGALPLLLFWLCFGKPINMIHFYTREEWFSYQLQQHC